LGTASALPLESKDAVFGVSLAEIMEPVTGMSLHLLALRRDIARRLDDSLATIMMLIELVSEALEHVMKLAAGRICPRGSTGIAIAVSLNAAA
jgi:hypothetical protein